MNTDSRNKKKILYIENVASIFAVNFYIAAAKAAQQLGYEFHVAYNAFDYSKENKKKIFEQYGVIFHQIDFIRQPYHLGNIKAFKQICNLIEKEKIDYIHCNTPIGGVVGRLAGLKCKVKKVIYQAHGFHFFEGSSAVNWLIYYPIEKILAHFTDTLITINKEDYNLAKKKMHLRGNGKVYYVPGVGVDLEQFKNDVDRKVVRESLGFTDKDIVCIAMGDLIKRKNYSVAIEAIGNLKNEFTNLHIIICGEGPEKESLKALARKMDIRDRIHFLGFRSDIKDLLAVSDFFFFTSLQEGMPRSTSEAMASGLPILCSAIRGNVDLIDSKSGLLFNPNSIKDTTNKLEMFLKSDFKKMGSYNLNHIKEFSLDHVTEYLFKIYSIELI